MSEIKEEEEEIAKICEIYLFFQFSGNLHDMPSQS